MAQSSIEWTEMTWNPVTGCDKISAGCKICYAEVMAKRLKAMGVEKYQNEFILRFICYFCNVFMRFFNNIQLNR